MKTKVSKLWSIFRSCQACGGSGKWCDYDHCEACGGNGKICRAHGIATSWNPYVLNPVVHGCEECFNRFYWR